VNTSQQLGGAVGVAALVAVATARTGELAASGTPSPAALTEGFSACLTVGDGIAAAAAVLAAMLLGERRRRTLTPLLRRSDERLTPPGEAASVN
jgi:hypothetical protein